MARKLTAHEAHLIAVRVMFGNPRLFRQRFPNDPTTPQVRSVLRLAEAAFGPPPPGIPILGKPAPEPKLVT